MPKRILDQDDFIVRAIVWYGSGEVVGNWVTVTVREYDGIFSWFAKVEDTMGHRLAAVGLANSFDEAHGAIMRAVCKMLEVEDEETGA